MIVIAPSILSADFARLGEQVVESELGGADRIHVDVMDGHFVPNLSMGPAVVGSLRRVTKLGLEVHLMVNDPQRFVDPFVSKGADTLIAHVEVFQDAGPFVEQVRGLKKKVGLAIRPDTPVEAIEPYLKGLDLALCMTVHPGYSGQAFLPESPGRIRHLRELLDRHNPACELEVDGGIGEDTARTVVEAGARVLVAASAVFGHRQGPAQRVRQLLAVARG